MRKYFIYHYTFSRYILELHKLHSEPAEGNTRQSRSFVASSSLPDHKSLDEDVNEYLSFRSVEASSCLKTPPVVWRCSFLLRRDIKQGRLAKFHQYLIRRPDAA